VSNCNAIEGLIQLLTLVVGQAPGEKIGDNGNFFEDFGVWKNAPILTGSTKFEPLPDVKNIMITGGAGFM
jgi:dTDP-glucose 4,6-dehydratase